MTVFEIKAHNAVLKKSFNFKTKVQAGNKLNPAYNYVKLPF